MANDSKSRFHHSIGLVIGGCLLSVSCGVKKTQSLTSNVRSNTPEVPAPGSLLGLPDILGALDKTKWMRCENAYTVLTDNQEYNYFVLKSLNFSFSAAQGDKITFKVLARTETVSLNKDCSKTMSQEEILGQKMVLPPEAYDGLIEAKEFTSNLTFDFNKNQTSPGIHAVDISYPPPSSTLYLSAKLEKQSLSFADFCIDTDEEGAEKCPVIRGDSAANRSVTFGTDPTNSPYKKSNAFPLSQP